MQIKQWVEPVSGGIVSVGKGYRPKLNWHRKEKIMRGHSDTLKSCIEPSCKQTEVEQRQDIFCGRCDGYGVIEDGVSRCLHCDGTGYSAAL